MIEVRYTDNLYANLLSIEAFWTNNTFPYGFDQLIDELDSRTIANLQNHPRVGRNFLQRQLSSKQAEVNVQKLRRLLVTLNTNLDIAEIREYVMADYQLLYCLSGGVIHLLGIKHQKQLSFAIDD